MNDVEMSQDKVRMSQYAQTSNLEEFADLLRDSGQDYFSYTSIHGGERNSGTCLDAIKSGVAHIAEADIKAAKNKLIHDYQMDEGEFAKEKQEVPADVMREFRDSIKELTSELRAVKKKLAKLENSASQKRPVKTRVQAA